MGAVITAREDPALPEEVRGKPLLKQWPGPLRSIILSTFLKPWHYQQTLFFLLLHIFSCHTRSSEGLGDLSGPLPWGLQCGLASLIPTSLHASKALQGGFLRRRLVEMRRTAYSPGGRPALPYSASQLARAKDIPSPCFLLHWNKHRICCTGLWGAGRGRPRRQCLQFTQHPPVLWLQTASPSTLLSCGSKLPLR